MVVAAGVIAGATLIAVGVQAYMANQAHDSDKARIAAANQIADKAIAEYQLPKGQATPIPFEEYAMLQSYRPEVAQFIQEQAPHLIGEAQSQQVIQAQKQVMSQMQEQAATGHDEISDSQQAQLLSDVQGQSSANRASLLRDYSNRGIAGGGQDVLSQMAAGASTDQNARQTALNIAAQQQDRRTQALQSLANMATNVRGQNFQVEQANNNTLDAYNQRNTMQKRAYIESVANAHNQANMFNLQQGQNIANMNTSLNNQMGALNIERQDAQTELLRNAENQRSAMGATLRTGVNVMQGQADQANLTRQLGMLNTLMAGAGSAVGGYNAGIQAEASQSIAKSLAERNTPAAAAQPTPSSAAYASPMQMGLGVDPGTYSTGSGFTPSTQTASSGVTLPTTPAPAPVTLAGGFHDEENLGGKDKKGYY